MKITSIKAQVKTKGRFSIYLDDAYSFSLSEKALLESGLTIGQELKPGDVKHFKKLSSEDKLYNQALRYVALRPRSEWEIHQYLKRKCDEPSQNTKLLNTLSNYGYINDEDFARRWVESRRLLKPVSRRKLRLELLQKHVSNEIISGVLAQDQTDDIDELRILITKKRSQTRYQDDTKLMQYLLRQGFNYEDIKKAFSEES